MSGASSRNEGTVTYTAVSGRAERRAECAPQQTPAPEPDECWSVFHSPDVKGKTSMHAPQMDCTNTHLIISDNEMLNHDTEKELSEHLQPPHQAAKSSNNFTFLNLKMFYHQREKQSLPAERWLEIKRRLDSFPPARWRFTLTTVDGGPL